MVLPVALLLAVCVAIWGLSGVATADSATDLTYIVDPPETAPAAVRSQFSDFATEDLGVEPIGSDYGGSFPSAAPEKGLFWTGAAGAATLGTALRVGTEAARPSAGPPPVVVGGLLLAVGVVLLEGGEPQTPAIEFGTEEERERRRLESARQFELEEIKPGAVMPAVVDDETEIVEKILTEAFRCESVMCAEETPDDGDQGDEPPMEAPAVPASPGLPIVPRPSAPRPYTEFPVGYPEWGSPGEPDEYPTGSGQDGPDGDGEIDRCTEAGLPITLCLPTDAQPQASTSNDAVDDPAASPAAPDPEPAPGNRDDRNSLADEIAAFVRDTQDGTIDAAHLAEGVNELYHEHLDGLGLPKPLIDALAALEVRHIRGDIDDQTYRAEMRWLVAKHLALTAHAAATREVAATRAR